MSNPFEAPASAPADYAITPLPNLTEEGNLWLGFALGFGIGLWGLLGALFLAKPRTKKGAGIGFLSRIGVTLLVVGIMVALD